MSNSYRSTSKKNVQHLLVTAIDNNRYDITPRETYQWHSGPDNTKGQTDLIYSYSS